MGKGSEGDDVWVTKTPVSLEAESNFQHNAYYWLRPRKRKILSSGADKYYLRQRKTVKERFSLGTGNEINSDLLNEQSQLILLTNYLNIELVHQIVRLLYDEKTRYKGLEKRSSKKVGSSSVPCKTIQIYHGRHNKCENVQPFFEVHNKPVQVYRRRIKKNQRSNKCKTVRPFFSEGQSKKRKRSILSTEGLKGSRRKDVSLPIHKKPRLQASRSESGPLVKHCKNSQIHHKKQDALDETASETDKIILRPKVILDEETIQEWKFLVEKPEHEGCKFERCDERWEIERALFHGRVISFISRMHLIQGNRQFSKWKGSIVDSVAGVFLAQNVADNLSSSAFMSLAAQYPSNEVRFKSTFHNGNGKTSLEKSSKGHSNNKNRGINQRTNRNGGKKKKEETRYQQAEPILTRKSKNADLKSEAITWENIRTLSSFINPKERSDSTLDAIDWHAVHAATAEKISEAIMQRGMDKKLARRIKNFIHRLILEQGNVDLEWLREVQPEKAKEYLLSIYGLGVKSVECIRLLTLRHQAFPVDTNVGRVLVRLGWVPIQPLPRGKKMNLLKMYPDVKDVHKYLWPRLCTLDHLALYEFHHQMITFGKVFCTKSSPNCNACPMKAECRHFASAFTSERVLLTGPGEKSSENIDTSLAPLDSTRHADSSQANIVSYVGEASNSQHSIGDHQNELITYPALECIGETNIEDYGASDIPTITFDPKAFMENLLSYIDESDLSINDTDLSKARVIATQEVPLPKLKHIGRLRTEHQVYELPDSHPLLEGLEKREPEDACPYLLALRTPGNAASEEPTKEKRESCNCDGTQNEVDASNIQTVSGTLLIPCRTANKGKFPLNGTYFQVNEVFADEESTQQPIEVPRVWIWNLPRRTLYCGTSIRAIFKGMSTKEVQHCFWRGYVCLRGFNRKTRIPGPLPYDLHRPISKSGKAKRSSQD
ncbi:protein ROS1A [Capsicum galapagoense]